MAQATDAQKDIRVPAELPVETPGKSPEAEAVERVAAGKDMSAQDHMDALSWLLADDVEEVGGSLDVELNVGASGVEQWITWTIKPVDHEVLRSIQQSGNRQMRRAGVASIDVQDSELRIVVAGTLSPDLQEAARVKKIVAPDPMYGPVQIVRHRFRNKPGLITQLATRIMDLSGFDEADVRDAHLVKAAKNS